MSETTSTRAPAVRQRMTRMMLGHEQDRASRLVVAESIAAEINCANKSATKAEIQTGGLAGVRTEVAATPEALEALRLT